MQSAGRKWNRDVAPGLRRWMGRIAAGLALAFLSPVMVSAEPVSFLTSTLPDGVRGVEYRTGDPPADVFLEAKGGVPPYSYAFLGGRLPDGILLETSGRLTGVPQACGSFVFQVQVRDAVQGFSNETFLLSVGGPPALVAPPSLAATVVAGGQATLALDLRNQGCESLAFHLESVDGGTNPAAARNRMMSRGSLATLLKMGAPIPLTLGRLAGRPGISGRGWFVDGAGRLLDAEGNSTPAVRETLKSGLGGAGLAGAKILYVNESAITGERDRLQATGHAVAQAVVPEALDLDTLRGFDLVWLTAATDSAFPSRDALLTYVWEGGGLVISQIQVAGETPLLPPGYALSSLPGGADGNPHLLTFTAAAASDPLTATLDTSDLPSNFDMTSISASGSQWNWLAVQTDRPDRGTLATAIFGAGRFVYHSGNLGTSVVPGARRGSDDFIVQVVNSASSGLTQTSCAWLQSLGATSDGRPEFKTVDTVRPADDSSETVTVNLSVDATNLNPATYQCDVAVLTAVPGQIQNIIPVTLTVSNPPDPRFLSQSLPRAQPDVPYAASLKAAGGVLPYSFALVGGSLPAGLSLEPVQGTVFGTPSESGEFMPVFRITDSAGAFAETAFS
ncbi:MAG: Ig domain-containing protein, partial [Acidobacteriota bacterium]